MKKKGKPLKYQVKNKVTGEVYKRKLKEDELNIGAALCSTLMKINTRGRGRLGKFEKDFKEYGQENFIWIPEDMV